MYPQEESAAESCASRRVSSSITVGEGIIANAESARPNLVAWMAGVGEAASIVSFISLSIQLFDGCVKGFVLLSAAQALGSRGDVLRCQLEWEHYCLNEWATTVGLFKEPPELNVPYPPIVQSTLSNLEQLLTDAAKLKNDYGLDVTITDEEIRGILEPKRLFGRILDKARPQFVNDTAKVYSRRNNPWKKLKWASVDEENLRLLLKDIRYFNKRLLGLLHNVDQRLKSSEDNAIMRSIVSQTSDKTLLDVMAGPLNTVDAAIAASARLKHRGLLLDLVGSTSPRSVASSSQMTLVPSVKASTRKNLPVERANRLRRNPEMLSGCEGHVSSAISREIAHYDNQAIIVEWKDVERSLESKLKYRIANVAALLTEMEDSSFHSLSCLGYLKAVKSGRYAYLFQPPATMCSGFSMRTLQDLLNQSSQRPSLNSRIHIAVNLTETMLQLHTSGWMHKCIRPDNLLFFKTKSADWNIGDSLPPAYLGGYEYARADNPLETTEAPSAQRTSDMYRHPLTIGRGRVPFNKSFDLYSLGCVLLELGFWAPLQTVLLHYLRRKASNPLDDISSSVLVPENDTEYYFMVGEKQRLIRETGLGTIHADLCHRMGFAYSQIVMTCLHAATSQVDSDTEDIFDSLGILEESLATLRGLAAAV